MHIITNNFKKVMNLNQSKEWIMEKLGGKQKKGKMKFNIIANIQGKKSPVFQKLTPMS